mgnify:CR=1 FL=1
MKHEQSDDYLIFEDATLIDKLESYYLNNKDSKNDFIDASSRLIAEDILLIGILKYDEFLTLLDNDFKKECFIYVRKRLFLSRVYLTENKELKNIYAAKDISKITKATQKFLYAYCNKTEALHFDEQDLFNVSGNGLIDNSNHVTYNGHTFKLSYEQYSVAPNCDDIFIKV